MLISDLQLLQGICLSGFNSCIFVIEKRVRALFLKENKVSLKGQHKYLFLGYVTDPLIICQLRHNNCVLLFNKVGWCYSISLDKCSVICSGRTTIPGDSADVKQSM